MIIRGIGWIIFSVALWLILIFFYLKYFEREGIYYPSSHIICNPSDLGLDYQEIFFETSDKVRLNGWFVKAKRGFATILFCHGNAGNIGDRVEIIKMFVGADLDVFIFDYRGYGKSEGRPSERGLYLDARAAYNYLIDVAKLSASGIVIYGKSLGANVAIDLASKLDRGFLICDSGFISALEMGKKLFPYLPRFLLKLACEVDFNALEKIKKVKIPKLIIHSRDDEVIPFLHGKRLFEEAMPPKEFYEISGFHNEAMFVNSSQYLRRIIEFIKRYKNSLTS